MGRDPRGSRSDLLEQPATEGSSRMSGQYDNNNRGSAWLSKQKYPDGPRTEGVEKGKGKPDYNGSINIEGRDYFFDMWLRPMDSKNEKAPAFTFKVKAKDAQPGGHPDRFRNEPAGSAARLDDDIPFAAEFR
jgi:hypothetical protein